MRPAWSAATAAFTADVPCAQFDAKALESRAAGVVLGVRDGGRGRVVAAFTEGGATGIAAGVAAGAVSAPAGALALWVGGATRGRIVVLRGARGDDARLDTGWSTARDAPIARGGSNSLETRGGDESGASRVSRREACLGVRQRRGRYDVSSFPRRREVELGQLGFFLWTTVVVQSWQARTLFVTSIPRGPALGGMSGTDSRVSRSRRRIVRRSSTRSARLRSAMPPSFTSSRRGRRRSSRR